VILGIGHLGLAKTDACKTRARLKKFKVGMGADYLVDLCGRPVDRLDKEKRKRVCTESEVRLARTSKQLQPKTIITIVRSISTNVERAQQGELDRTIRRYVDLPYPGRWRHHQVAFEEALSPILHRQLSNVALLLRNIDLRGQEIH
jgi:hypothetical protein